MESLEDVKKYVKKMLVETDYALLSDVLIDNRDEFIAYRKMLRYVLKNPYVPFMEVMPPNPIWTEAGE